MCSKTQSSEELDEPDPEEVDGIGALVTPIVSRPGLSFRQQSLQTDAYSDAGGQLSPQTSNSE